METTKRSLVLTFGTPVNTQESITITNPAELLTATEIKEAMTKMLASGAIGESVQANSIEGVKYAKYLRCILSVNFVNYLVFVKDLLLKEDRMV